jgi:hypothetical protein
MGFFRLSGYGNIRAVRRHGGTAISVEVLFLCGTHKETPSVNVGQSELAYWVKCMDEGLPSATLESSICEGM